MKTKVLKHKDKPSVLAMITGELYDWEDNHSIVSQSLFYDPIDEHWTVVICYWD